jgi:hypothetical protein
MGEFESRDGFPYFWLGAEAESIPTPWRTVWLGSSTEERAPAPKFDRAAYQREYMRRRRAAQVRKSE